MTLPVTDIEFKLLRDLIEKRCGILLGDNKAYLVENRLSRLVKEAGCKSFGEFYFKLKSLPSNGTWIDRVVDAITTNETSWFRLFAAQSDSRRDLPLSGDKLEYSAISVSPRTTFSR